MKKFLKIFLIFLILKKKGYKISILFSFVLKSVLKCDIFATGGYFFVKRFVKRKTDFRLYYVVVFRLFSKFVWKNLERSVYTYISVR